MCDVLLPELIAQILGHMRKSVSLDTFNAVITKLSGRLQEELEGRDIAVSMNPHYIQRIVQTVHRELCKKKSQSDITVNLLVLQDKLCKTIVDTLVKQLMKPRETLSIRKFLTAVYTSMANSLNSYGILDNDYTK